MASASRGDFVLASDISSDMALGLNSDIVVDDDPTICISCVKDYCCSLCQKMLPMSLGICSCRRINLRSHYTTLQKFWFAPQSSAHNNIQSCISILGGL